MRKLFLFVLFSLSISAGAQLKINEIMTNNVSAVLDNTYNYSMWVELFNTSGTTSVNQGTFYFSDNLNLINKWKAVYGTIPARGYSVLWFERDDYSGHATFKLNPEGGKLYLLNATLQIVDSVVYPPQYRNISYGRKKDNDAEWVFFEQPSAGTTNNTKTWASDRCATPVFSLAGGFYPSAQTLSFDTPVTGDTIYYTRNGAEPSRASIRFVAGSKISISGTTVLRAKTFSKNKLSSDIATSTFFINIRDPHLPVVSIVTDPVNLTDDYIGIYVVGKNGKTGNGSNSPVNFNQDWDRPANFEFFDTTHVSRLNQELDIAISGAWSRLHDLKSLKISPRKKFGDNRLRYDFFAATKPGRKYKDIQLRNGGNDYSNTMLRDAFMQTIVMKRMNLDCLAYEPAVLFMNGVYYGLEDLRERSSKDFLYSNYGLEEEDILLLETTGITTNVNYQPLYSYVLKSDLTKSAVYDSVCKMMDVDNFMDYTMSEIYYGNTDWPANNIKVWKKKSGGKWRWILYDTDFGFDLDNNGLYNHNTLLYALGEKTDQIPATYSTILFSRLMLNETFRNKFINRFSIHLSTTFKPERVGSILDSLTSKVANELVYHKQKWGTGRSLTEDVHIMKNFAEKRPGSMMGFLSSRFANSNPIQTIHLTSNAPNVSFKMNSESIVGNEVDLLYFKNKALTIQANPGPGFRFKQWNVYSSQTPELIKMGDKWSYFDGSALPAANWNTSAYSDAAWKTGQAQMGYGGKGETTVIGYGANASAKYPTAYFRKTVTVNGLSNKDDFSITAFVDDGAAVYVNGQEVGRYLLPAGTLTYNTLSTTYNNGDYVTFSVPKSFMKEGENLIAVEVHQTNGSSSDLIFNLQMTYHTSVTSGTNTSPVYSTVLAANLNLEAVYDVVAIEDTVDDSSIFINELVADNSLIMDEYGEKDDYIELFNAGTKDVNVAGWYLSDIQANRTLFQIPNTNSGKTIIPAKGRLIIWADEDLIQGELHADLKLGKGGEVLLLSRKNAFGEIVVVDSVAYPVMNSDISYSRVPDGSEEWFIQAPTFNSTNGDIVSVDDHSVSNIDLYPTLVNESFTVRNASGALLTLTDLTGKVVYRSVCESDVEIVQARSLQRGLYLVTVGNSKYKIIKR